MTPPPLNKAPQECTSKPEEISSFPVVGVTTAKLMKRIEEEGEGVWFDEYTPPNNHNFAY